MSARRVGFIGMGIMGRAMAANLVRAGHEVTVYNRTPEKCQELMDLGAFRAETVEALLGEAELVVTMLTGPDAVDALLFGGGEDRKDLFDKKVVVNMSSVAPAYTQGLAARLAALGARFVDAPVSGSKKPAEEGTLVILAGGEQADIDEAEPVLLCMGKKVVRCGPAGAGSTMKMAVNLLLGVMMEGLAEMLHFGGKGGLTRDAMLDVVTAGPLMNGLFGLKEPMLRSGEFPTQFPLKHMAKDLKFAVDTAFANGAQAPAANAMMQLYARGVAQGLGDEDFAAVFKVLEG